MPYRSQHGGHELVRLLGLHEAAHLEHADSQAGYDGGMLRQGLLQEVAVLLVIFQRAYLGHSAKALEGTQVRLVDMGEVRVCNNDVWQGLDITQAMRESMPSAQLQVQEFFLLLPRWQFQSAVVCRVDQAPLSQRSSKEGQLSQAYGSSFTLHPSAMSSVGVPSYSIGPAWAYSSRAEDGLQVGATAAACTKRL